MALSSTLFFKKRKVVKWRGKKFCYRTSMKNRVTTEPGYFFAPHIPIYLFDKPIFK